MLNTLPRPSSITGGAIAEDESDGECDSGSHGSGKGKGATGDDGENGGE